MRHQWNGSTGKIVEPRFEGMPWYICWAWDIVKYISHVSSSGGVLERTGDGG